MTGKPTIDDGIVDRVMHRLYRHHIGSERAIVKADLARELCLNPRQVEMAIQVLRRHGNPIASSCTANRYGYFIARTKAELAPTLAQLRHRIGEQAETARALEGAFASPLVTGRLFV